MQKFVHTIISEAGRPVEGAAVYIYEAGTSTLAPLFEDDGITGRDNPLTSDAYGMVQASIPNGRYDVQVKHGANLLKEINGLSYYDPEDDGG